MHAPTVSDSEAERPRGEQMLREQRDMLELIATGAPLAECLDAITAAVSRLQPGARAAILLADEARTRFTDIRADAIPDSFGEGLRGAPINELAIGTCGTAVFRAAPVGCVDIADDERWSADWRQLCVRHGILACHSQPVPGADGRPVASLMLCFAEPRPPAEWELEIARFGVHLAAIALDRARAVNRHLLLIDELNHRVKNTLAIVQSLARQTLRGKANEALRTAFDGRLNALAGAHDLLTRTEWQEAELGEIIAGAVAAWQDGRISIDGPAVQLAPKRAVTVAMAMHELATNAAKYGALAHPGGTVTIRWTVEGENPPILDLVWREKDGPPVAAPSESGFGTRMIEATIAHEFGGTAHLDYRPDGLVCTIHAPLTDDGG